MRLLNSWKSYTRLVAALATEAGEPVEVCPEGSATEKELLSRLSRRLRVGPDRAAAEALLASLDLSVRHYRHHLRYVATWDADRRRLLAEGASMRVLEDFRQQGLAGQLKGLTLAGSVQVQRQQIAHHLAFQERALKAGAAAGWLEPQPSRTPRSVSEPRPIWLYPAEGLEQVDALHPTVARSLIAKYLPHKGVVIDPMAGSGTVALEASRLGHRVWASDLYPGAPFIAKHDLERDDLADHVDGQGDLLVLHPPLRRDLQDTTEKFETRLHRFIENAVGSVKLGGLVALIVASEEAPGVLQTLTHALVELVNPEKAGRRRRHDLTAHHLAVARDGSQAWHILIARNGSADR